MWGLLRSSFKELASKMTSDNKPEHDSGLVDNLKKRAALGLGVPTSLIYDKDPKKLSKVRGKVPSRSQRQILTKNGISEEDQESYLIYKISFIQDCRDKRLNKSSSKVENWTLIHRETGELKEVYIE